MKRFLLILLAVSALSAPLYAETDIDLSLGASTNYFSLGLDSSKGQAEFKGSVSLNVEGDFYFNRGNGFYVDLGYVESTIILGAGYAYTTPVGNLDMILTAGPFFELQGSNVTMGADFKTVFQTYFSGNSGMFARFGASLNLEFLSIANNDVSGYFNMELLIPEVAIGYKF